MTLVFKTYKFEELHALNGFSELVKEYALETANPAIGAPAPQLQNYEELDKEGNLVCVGCVDIDSGLLVGLAGLRISKSQHYAFPLVAIDGFYLLKAFRKGSAGLRLLKAIKLEVSRIGSPGLVFMAPPGSRFDALCGKLGMTHTHNAYWCRV